MRFLNKKNNMLGGIAKTAISSAIVGGVGTLFAPASAAAAGGALNVMGACAIGGVVVAPFSGILAGITGIAALSTSALAKNSYAIAAICGAFTLAELLVSALISAEIGAAVLGISAHPVFVCSLVGAAAIGAPAFLLGLAVILGLACIFNALTGAALPNENMPTECCSL